MLVTRMGYFPMKRNFIVILFMVLTVLIFQMASTSALPKDELCYFNSTSIGGGLGGCAKNMDAEIKEIHREPQISHIHVKVKKRGTYAGSIMFQTCCFSKIAKSRGYRYFVTLEQNELKDCKECEWSYKYVLGFLFSKDDSLIQVFPSRIKKDKEYKIEDINEFYPICGYLPIPSYAFHRAVYFGDLKKVKQLAGKNRDLLNEKDEQGFRPLHIAAVEGYSEIVDYLVKSGADINGKGMYGWSPLHMAVKFNQIQIIKLLLSLKADPDIRMDLGNTPLHNAAYEGNVEIADIFIKSGVDVDVMDDEGNSPLHGAASRGHIEMVKFLIGKGANPKRKNKAEQTPLFFADTQKHTQVVELLMKYQ